MRAFETGCWCWVPVLVLVPGAGAGVHVVETGCWCWWWCCELAVGVVSWLCTWWGQVAGAGAGAGCRCWCCELAVHVVETGCWCWCRVAVLVPASDSEVITTAASDSEGYQTAACSSEGRPSAASDNEVPAVMGRINLCTQHHTVLSLERSLSISAVGYLQFCFGRQLCQGLYCLRA